MIEPKHRPNESYVVTAKEKRGGRPLYFTSCICEGADCAWMRIGTGQWKRIVPE